jgi:hypothetical protein
MCLLRSLFSVYREKKQKAVMREKEILCRIKDGWSPTAPFFVKLISSFQVCMFAQSSLSWRQLGQKNTEKIEWNFIEEGTAIK